MPRWGNADGSDSVPNRVDGPSIPRSNVDTTSIGGPAKITVLPSTVPQSPGVDSAFDRRGNWAVPIGDATRMPMTSDTKNGHRALCTNDRELITLIEEMLLVNKSLLAEVRMFRLAAEVNADIAPVQMGEVFK